MMIPEQQLKICLMILGLKLKTSNRELMMRKRDSSKLEFLPKFQLLRSQTTQSAYLLKTTKTRKKMIKIMLPKRSRRDSPQTKNRRKTMRNSSRTPTTSRKTQIRLSSSSQTMVSKCQMHTTQKTSRQPLCREKTLVTS